jgi:hypothetical protein
LTRFLRANRRPLRSKTLRAKPSRRTVAETRPIGYISPNAPVAQLDRALPSEGKGHTFESCRVRHHLIKQACGSRRGASIVIEIADRALWQAQGRVLEKRLNA